MMDRAFNPRDIAPTGIGFAIGLFYGFMGLLCVSLLTEDLWIIILAMLPFLVLQLAVVLGVARLMRARQQRLDLDTPPATPSPWIRRYAVSFGVIAGGCCALVGLILNGPLLGHSL